MVVVIKYIKRLFLIFFLCIVIFSCGKGRGDGESDELARLDRLSELIVNAEDKKRIGAFAEAIDELKLAIKLDASFIAAYYLMGVIYEQWGQKEEAIKSYQAALRLDSNHVKSRLGLGSVYSSMVKNDLAIKQLKKVAELSPKNPDIYFKIALEYWYLQRLPETAQYYQKVIELEPDHLQTHLNLASVYEKMGDWLKTLGEIETALYLAKQKEDKYSIAIADEKLKFIKGRMNLTDKDLEKRTQPPFD